MRADRIAPDERAKRWLDRVADPDSGRAPRHVSSKRSRQALRALLGLLTARQALRALLGKGWT